MPVEPIENECFNAQDLRQIIRDEDQFTDEEIEREFRAIFYNVCAAGQCTVYNQAHRFKDLMQEYGHTGCYPSLDELKDLVQEYADDTLALLITEQNENKHLQQEIRALKDNNRALEEKSKRDDSQKRKLEEDIQRQKRKSEEYIQARDEEIKRLKKELAQEKQLNQDLYSRNA